MQQRWLFTLSAIGLSGCAAVVSVDGDRYRVTSDAFGEYVERVFRSQNKTADDLAFAVEDLPPGRQALAAELNGAEARLLLACQELNRLAASRRDGVALPNRVALLAARSAPDCERADRSARQLLATLD